MAMVFENESDASVNFGAVRADQIESYRVWSVEYDEFKVESERA